MLSMLSEAVETDWGFGPAIHLLRSLSLPKVDPGAVQAAPAESDAAEESAHPLNDQSSHLGDFSELWKLFQVQRDDTATPDAPLSDLEVENPPKIVRWRDELDGADLEDNDEPALLDSAASLRTQKRAARRARARARAEKSEANSFADDGLPSDSATDAESGEGGLGRLPRSSKRRVAEQRILGMAVRTRARTDRVKTKSSTEIDLPLDTTTELESGEELERLRRSPDRKAIIQNILGRVQPTKENNSPPTSPSPPKRDVRLMMKKKDWPIANPFLWAIEEALPSPHRPTISPQDGFSSTARKAHLIKKLAMDFSAESRYLANKGLMEPAFTPLNTSDIGIHVFVDISNIMIGFHDCLKVARDLPIVTRIRRVPMCFHNFSLVLERGRPAAKRVLVGSDRTPVISEAKAIGYETNILERVHKAKEMTARQKKYSSGGDAYSGVSSGSETNTGAAARTKWVEQAVDEILHLKILESVIDADKASTIVLATGDAAEAEYSGGFMRMVERALEKGWMVELVSFKLNTSTAYTRTDFRAKWGPMFKWIQLDAYVELLIDGS